MVIYKRSRKLTRGECPLIKKDFFTWNKDPKSSKISLEVKCSIIRFQYFNNLVTKNRGERKNLLPDIYIIYIYILYIYIYIYIYIYQKIWKNIKS